MKKSSLAVLLSLLSFAGIAFAQAPTSEIRESTDPERAAAVERRAEELRAQQEASTGGGQATSGASGTASDTMDQKPAHEKKHKSKKKHGKHHEGRSSGSSDNTSGTSDTSGEQSSGSQ